MGLLFFRAFVRHPRKGLLTFLAVGLTGTGKSELCHWMTGGLLSNRNLVWVPFQT